MAKFVLRYARIVYLSRELDSTTREEAEVEAYRLEEEGKLGIRHVEPLEGSVLDDVWDYDFYFEVERVS